MLDLKPFTEYEFQISSKLHLYKGSWSDWSESLRTQTPEEGTCPKKRWGGGWSGKEGWIKGVKDKREREEDVIISLE